MFYQYLMDKQLANPHVPTEMLVRHLVKRALQLENMIKDILTHAIENQEEGNQFLPKDESLTEELFFQYWPMPDIHVSFSSLGKPQWDMGTNFNINHELVKENEMQKYFFEEDGDDKNWVRNWHIPSISFGPFVAWDPLDVFDDAVEDAYVSLYKINKENEKWIADFKDKKKLTYLHQPKKYKFTNDWVTPNDICLIKDKEEEEEGIPEYIDPDHYTYMNWEIPWDFGYLTGQIEAITGDSATYDYQWPTGSWKTILSKYSRANALNTKMWRRVYELSMTTNVIEDFGPGGKTWFAGGFCFGANAAIYAVYTAINSESQGITDIVSVQSFEHTTETIEEITKYSVTVEATFKFTDEEGEVAEAPATVVAIHSQTTTWKGEPTWDALWKKTETSYWNGFEEEPGIAVTKG